MHDKRHLKFLGNAILLTLAVLFSMLFVLTYVLPAKTDVLISKGFVKSYVSLQKRRTDNVLADMATGRTASAFGLLSRWKPVTKGDRTYEYKRTLFRALSDHLYDEGRYKELLDLSSSWTELDDRDVTASAFRLEALRKTTTATAEAEDGLRKLWRRFPTNPALIRFYSGLAAKYGDGEGLESARKRSMAVGWKLYWDIERYGIQWNWSQSVVLSPLSNHFWSVDVEVPESTIAWRIYPPAYSRVRISDFRVLVHGIRCVIPVAQLSLTQMKTEDTDLLVQGGAAPFFSFPSTSCSLSDHRGKSTATIQFRAVPEPT